jgi:hypothetical protein
MTEKGIEEMEKRAAEAGSPWRVFALLAISVTVGRALFRKVGRMFRTAGSANQSGRDQ